MAKAATIIAKVDTTGWLSSYKELYRQHDRAIPATFATVATVLSGGVSTVNQLGEPIGAFVMIGLSCFFAVLSAVTWKGISKHSTLTRFIKIAGPGGFFLWSVVWTVITWRNKPRDKWTNFTWDDIATIQSYLTYFAVISWRWLVVIAAIVLAFFIGRLMRQRSEAEKKTDQGTPGQGLGLSDNLRGCQDEWLHEKAQTDKTSIEKLIRIVGILYNPDFEKAHIDFTLCVFNISLYDIEIDNAIKKGAIRFGEDNEKFFYPANIESEHPIDCPSRGDAFFVIRQAIRAEEIERLRKQDNYLIRFYDLEIMFQGGKHFPQTDHPLRLDVREHYVETQKRMWRAWDQVGFVFGYNDEQWAAIQSGNAAHSIELAELRAKQKEKDTSAAEILRLQQEVSKLNEAIGGKRQQYKTLKTERDELKAKLTAINSSDGSGLVPDSLRALFDSEISSSPTRPIAKQTTWRIVLHDESEEVAVVVRVVVDELAGAEFLGCYIPPTAHTYKVCEILSDQVQNILDHWKGMGVTASPKGERELDLDDARYSGRIFVYYESRLLQSDIDRLSVIYRSKDLQPRFRGPNYFIAKKHESEAKQKGDASS